MWHMTKAEHEIWYWKQLARYYYVVALIKSGLANEDDIDEDMEEAYAEFCRRDDLFSKDKIGHFYSIKED